jgi:hypothetical protein
MYHSLTNPVFCTTPKADFPSGNSAADQRDLWTLSDRLTFRFPRSLPKASTLAVRRQFRPWGALPAA